MKAHQLVLTFLTCAVIGCGGSDSTDDAPDAAIATGVEEIDLGSVSSAPVTLTIPEHTLGFHLVVEVDDSNGTETVGITTITSPTGTVELANSVPTGTALPLGSTPYGIATMSVPMTTAQMPVEPGAWTVAFSVPPGKTAHARAYVRTTADGEFHGGTLDIRVYIPDGLMIAGPQPAHAITAATAASDPSVAARIDSFYTTLSQLYQLDRGTVEFVPLDADLVTLADDGARLRALRDTTSGNGRAAQFVWADGVTLFGTEVWGNSAWIPGDATEVGHALSGVVVNISTGFPAAADGMTMVHELGHFLGLFHTTELDRSQHDALSDTPECAAGATTCPDGNNIMFVTFYGASGGIGLTATAQQRSVVWASPLYDPR